MRTLFLLLLLTYSITSRADFYTKEIQCLAKMVYFEARGESSSGKEAVVDVMFNRVKHKEFPNTICANLHPSQYQWVKNNPRVKDNKLYSKIYKHVEKEYWEFILGTSRDSTRGSIFFSSNGKKPARRAYPTLKVGNHQFYGLK